MKNIGFLLLIIFIASSAWAKYDFSSTSPSGHKLYYSVRKNQGVVIGCSVVCPGNFSTTSHGYNGYSVPSGDIVIPSTVVYNGNTLDVVEIQTRAFSHCTDITSVSFPSTVEVIRGQAFYGCTSLEEITIPNNSSLKCIASRAFYNCTSLLQSLTLPEGFLSIGAEAFGNTVIWEINLPSTWRGALPRPNDNWSSITGSSNAFKDSYLDNINISMDNPYYKSVNGVVFSINEDTLIAWPPSKDDYSGGYMLYGYINLKAIGPYALSNLRGWSISKIDIPSGVELIEANAFSYNEDLKEIVIGKNVKDIRSQAFQYCTALTKVTIGTQVDSMDISAFQHCNNIQTIVLKTQTPPTIKMSNEKDPFASSSSAFIYVPCSKGAVYKSSKGWRKHSYYIEDFSYDYHGYATINGKVDTLQEPTCSNGSTLVLSAIPETGYKFHGWLIISNNNVDVYYDNPLTMQLTSDITFNASFDPIGGGTTAIDQIETPSPQIALTNGGIIVKDARDVIVYDITGKKLFDGIPQGGVVHLEHHGVFLVSINGDRIQKIVY